VCSGGIAFHVNRTAERLVRFCAEKLPGAISGTKLVTALITNKDFRRYYLGKGKREEGLKEERMEGRKKREKEGRREGRKNGRKNGRKDEKIRLIGSRNKRRKEGGRKENKKAGGR